MNYKNNTRVILLILLGGMLLTPLIVMAQPQQIGYVLNFKGDWFLNSSQKLTWASPVTAGGLVHLPQPKPADFIEIVDLEGKPLKTLSCNVDRCESSYRLPSTKRTNFLVRLVQVAMEMILTKPELPKKVAISRGPELRESVVKLVNQQVDLSFVLSNLARGRYLLRFKPEDANRAPDVKSVGSVTVDWNPDKPSTVLVEGLSYGLYTVELLSNADHEPLEPGSEALVLFSKPENFEKDSREFGEALRLTTSWGAAIRHDSKRIFLRAALTQLNAEAGK